MGRRIAVMLSVLGVVILAAGACEKSPSPPAPSKGAPPTDAPAQDVSSGLSGTVDRKSVV
jgi:hypothetical protein